MGTTTTARARGPASVAVAKECPPPLTTMELGPMSDAELFVLNDAEHRLIEAHRGRRATVMGEIARRQAFRAEGATSAEAWMIERNGVSRRSARETVTAGELLADLPHLNRALCSGTASFDQVAAVPAVATPETDAEWAAAAAEHSVRDLVELVRSQRPPTRAEAEQDQEARTLRFNETLRTMWTRLAGVGRKT
jgi:hypothetical protein